MEERFSDLKQDITNYVYAGTIVFILLALVFVVFLFLSIKRRNKMLYEKQNLEQKFQAELLRTQMEIREQTFKTISQEIHDNIGQMLSLAKMNLSKFEIDREHSDEAILSAKELVSKAVTELRDLSKTLNTDTISTIGLLKSIELELQLVEKTTGIKTLIEVNGHAQKLEPQKEVILFRIVQESLHNSIKHATPTQLYVQANFEDSFLQLSICDDGMGFNYTGNQQGSGLRNMQSRSRLIGAEWNLESSPGKGTKIHLTIPTIHQHDNDSTGR
jgi:two-component system, NarL family, sensor kinase